MAKKTGKKTTSAKKTVKTKSRMVENLECLMELHKLQGVLLGQLHKEVK